MKTKIFNVLGLLAAVHFVSTSSLHDVVFLVIVVVVVVGFNYLQQHDQVEKQRAAGHTELITRLDRWQQDVQGKATPSGERASPAERPRDRRGGPQAASIAFLDGDFIERVGPDARRA